MTPPAEYAFITTGKFVGDSAAASSPSVLTAARVLAPTFALNQLGYIARAFSLFGDAAIGAELRTVKAAVFADPGNDSTGRYEALLSSWTGRALYDLTDVPAPGTSGERFCRQPRLVLTAASDHVAESASALVGRPVRSVPEPLYGPRDVPRAPPARRRSRLAQWLARRAGVDTESWRLRLFWCGEEREVAAMAAARRPLADLGRSLPIALHCMAPGGAAIERLAAEFSRRDTPALEPSLEPWSAEKMARALASCDLVLLPDPGPASRSRLIGALHAGRLALAHPSPHHGRLAQFAWTGEDLTEGIRWSLSNSAEVLARLAAGQRHLDEAHTPAAVARTWVQLFTPPG
jgi:hypothetical protein